MFGRVKNYGCTFQPEYYETREHEFKPQKKTYPTDPFTTLELYIIRRTTFLNYINWLIS